MMPSPSIVVRRVGEEARWDMVGCWFRMVLRKEMELCNIEPSEMKNTEGLLKIGNFESLHRCLRVRP